MGTILRFILRLVFTIIPFQTVLAQYEAKVDSSGNNLITLDSIGNIISVVPLRIEVDQNHKTLYYPEKFTFANAIDTLDVLYGHEKKKMKAIRYVEGNVKRKVIVFDDSLNTMAETWFSAEKRYFSKTLYSTGAVRSVYTDNRLQKTFTDYYPSGVMESFTLQDSSGTILDLGFDSSGIKDFSYRYLANDSAAHMQFFYKNGTVANEYYLSNKPMPSYVYYRNGHLMMEGKVLGMHNAKVGKWIHYYPDGTIERECFFNDSIPNQKEGTWQWWNEQGILVKKEVYENDKLISKKEYLSTSTEKNKL